jgi:hypothetical protein
MPTTALNAILVTVRQTAAAHASALDELERAFAAETVTTIIILIFCIIRIHKKEALHDDNPTTHRRVRPDD